MIHTDYSVFLLWNKQTNNAKRLEWGYVNKLYINFKNFGNKTKRVYMGCF